MFASGKPQGAAIDFDRVDVGINDMVTRHHGGLDFGKSFRIEKGAGFAKQSRAGLQVFDEPFGSLRNVRLPIMISHPTLLPCLRHRPITVSYSTITRSVWEGSAAVGTPERCRAWGNGIARKAIGDRKGREGVFRGGIECSKATNLLLTFEAFRRHPQHEQRPRIRNT
jgi:hypothetical protein